MDNDLDKVVQRNKIKRETLYDEKKHKVFNYFKSLLSRVLICMILVLLSLIFVNKSSNNLKSFNDIVYEEYFDYSKFNSLYTKYLGSILPFKHIVDENVSTVFKEDFKYSSYEKYLDGYKIHVDKNYIVPVIQTGVVVFIGEKEKYGNTIIIEGMDGVDIWYANIDNINLQLYDYVLKGSLLGDITQDNMYLVLMRDEEYLSIEDYAI